MRRKKQNIHNCLSQIANAKHIRCFSLPVSSCSFALQIGSTCMFPPRHTLPSWDNIAIARVLWVWSSPVWSSDPYTIVCVLYPCFIPLFVCLWRITAKHFVSYIFIPVAFCGSQTSDPSKKVLAHLFHPPCSHAQTAIHPIACQRRSNPLGVPYPCFIPSFHIHWTCVSYNIKNMISQLAFLQQRDKTCSDMRGNKLATTAAHGKNNRNF